MSLTTEQVIAAYERMGATADADAINYWTTQSNTNDTATIYQAASEYINDPQFADIAQNAIDILNAQPNDDVPSNVAPVTTTTQSIEGDRYYSNMQSVSTDAIDTVIAAYAAMGRAVSPDDVAVIQWANQNASPVQIWQAAATYINDAQWHDVAVAAQNLLTAQNELGNTATIDQVAVKAADNTAAQLAAIAAANAAQQAIATAATTAMNAADDAANAAAARLAAQKAYAAATTDTERKIAQAQIDAAEALIQAAADKARVAAQAAADAARVAANQAAATAAQVKTAAAQKAASDAAALATSAQNAVDQAMAAFTSLGAHTAVNDAIQNATATTTAAAGTTATTTQKSLLQALQSPLGVAIATLLAAKVLS